MFVVIVTSSYGAVLEHQEETVDPIYLIKAHTHTLAASLGESNLGDLQQTLRRITATHYKDQMQLREILSTHQKLKHALSPSLVGCKSILGTACPWLHMNLWTGIRGHGDQQLARRG